MVGFKVWLYGCGFRVVASYWGWYLVFLVFWWVLAVRLRALGFLGFGVVLFGVFAWRFGFGVFGDLSGVGWRVLV